MAVSMSLTVRPRLSARLAARANGAKQLAAAKPVHAAKVAALPARAELKTEAAAEAAKTMGVAATLTGAATTALLAAPEQADAAQELAQLADGRPLLLAGLFLPVLGWVAFNIAAPAFRQLNNMSEKASGATGKKRAVTAALTGLTASALAAAPEHADAAQELVQLADGRPLLLAGLFLPVLGWVAFNIAAPAFRQLNNMSEKASGSTGKKRSAVAALTGLTAAALMAMPEQADAAQEMMQLADGRPLLLAGLFLPVLGWVAFNIAAPAFRQLNNMSEKASGATSKKR